MTALIIANTQIRQDAAGRYCLNDLHQASGGAKRHQPGDWLRLKQTQELVSEIKSVPGIPGTDPDVVIDEPVVTLQGGFVQGTYAVKELVYAYAMWISAAFHLHVIRAYDALVTQRVAEVSTPLLPQPQHRADQLVSAGRIFSAALRTARQARLPAPRAMRAAFECARRHTGIDWESELDIAAGDLEQLPAPPSCNVAEFHASWQDGTAGLPYLPVLSTDLHAAYQAWCSDRDLPAQPLARFISALMHAPGGPLVQRKRWRDGAAASGPHGFVIPLTQQSPPPGQTVDRWLGNCVRQWRAAVSAAPDDS